MSFVKSLSVFLSKGTFKENKNLTSFVAHLTILSTFLYCISNKACRLQVFVFHWLLFVPFDFKWTLHCLSLLDSNVKDSDRFTYFFEETNFRLLQILYRYRFRQAESLMLCILFIRSYVPEKSQFTYTKPIIFIAFVRLSIVMGQFFILSNSALSATM